MDNAPDTDLIREIEDFLTEHGMTPSRFGTVMMNDPRFVFDLRSGRELRRSTERALRAKMQKSRGEAA